MGPTTPRLIRLSGEDVKDGLLKGALPQLPLTTLNSVVSVVALSHDLFPDSIHTLSTRKMATSVAMMNLSSCWFGVMPACHGAGGLAAQYQFGARTGGAVIFLVRDSCLYLYHP